MESSEQYLPGDEEKVVIDFNSVEFFAEIAEIKGKKLASMDKGLRIILDTNGYDGLMGKLDELWNTEESVRVIICKQEI
jgi:hypothetical protein